MLTGKRFTISKATVALEANKGTRSLVTIPHGAIIEVTSAPAGPSIGTVAVCWEGRTLAMFAIDIEKRGIEIAEAASQNAWA